MVGQRVVREAMAEDLYGYRLADWLIHDGGAGSGPIEHEIESDTAGQPGHAYNSYIMCTYILHILREVHPWM